MIAHFVKQFLSLLRKRNVESSILYGASSISLAGAIRHGPSRRECRSEDRSRDLISTSSISDAVMRAEDENYIDHRVPLVRGRESRKYRGRLARTFNFQRRNVPDLESRKGYTFFHFFSIEKEIFHAVLARRLSGAFVRRLDYAHGEAGRC